MLGSPLSTIRASNARSSCPCLGSRFQLTGVTRTRKQRVLLTCTTVGLPVAINELWRGVRFCKSHSSFLHMEILKYFEPDLLSYPKSVPIIVFNLGLLNLKPLSPTNLIMLLTDTILRCWGCKGTTSCPQLAHRGLLPPLPLLYTWNDTVMRGMTERGNLVHPPIPFWGN